ncbi:hypothetical protein B0H12DRAFT_224725 [Mycena haematopus]|nr:hypothetical protein B0H12DRAFT_224725 [Mycena haematopus]
MYHRRTGHGPRGRDEALTTRALRIRIWLVGRLVCSTQRRCVRDRSGAEPSAVACIWLVGLVCDVRSGARDGADVQCGVAVVGERSVRDGVRASCGKRESSRTSAATRLGSLGRGLSMGCPSVCARMGEGWMDAREWIPRRSCTQLPTRLPA